MIRLIKWGQDMFKYIKKRYKMSLFRKHASLGRDLDICAESICHADRDGCIKIGDCCRVYAHIYSQDGGQIAIGDHTCIYRHTVIGSVSSIHIGRYVVISNNVHIYDNNNHPTLPTIRKQMCIDGFDGDAWKWRHSQYAPIVIEDNVWIGEYAAIMKGVRIGEGSVVAAHAVVTKDVPAYTIVAGNPAKVVKKLEHEE